jgi:DNA-directed RNA polymerase subunit RPC12/RpoP
MKHYVDDTKGDFRCSHCGYWVTSKREYSGVNNRNHCPYCLWSKHLDLFQAGDRLSACKSVMQPVGLALKIVHKKYNSPHSGEMMLVHRCVDCGKLSLNRIAADDDTQALWMVYGQSLSSVCGIDLFENIDLLGEQHLGLVKMRLLGTLVEQ